MIHAADAEYTERHVRSVGRSSIAVTPSSPVSMVTMGFVDGGWLVQKPVTTEVNLAGFDHYCKEFHDL